MHTPWGLGKALRKYQLVAAADWIEKMRDTRFAPARALGLVDRHGLPGIRSGATMP